MNNGNPHPFVSKTGSSKEIQGVETLPGWIKQEFEKLWRCKIIERIVFTNFCESKAKQPLNHHIHRGPIEKSEHFLTMIMF